MQCKICRQDNPAEARFCANCGAALVTAVEPLPPRAVLGPAPEPPAAPAEPIRFWGKYEWLATAFAIVIIAAVAVTILQVSTRTAPPAEPIAVPAPQPIPVSAEGPILEFGELAADDEEAKWENELGRWKPATALIDHEEKALTSRYFKENTYVERDNMGRILLMFEWDDEGSRLSEEVTSRLIDKPLAIFEGNEALRGVDGRPIVPIVRSAIRDKGQIEGLSHDDATRLSRLINAMQYRRAQTD